MKLSNIVKDMCTMVTAISIYARGRINADLFVRKIDYISYIQHLPRNYYNINLFGRKGCCS